MLLCLLAAVVGADVDPEPCPSTKVLAQARVVVGELIRQEGVGARQVVLKSATELYRVSTAHRQENELSEKRTTMDVEAAVSKMLQVKVIDWDKQMLLVVIADVQRTDGYRVEVTGVQVSSGKLRVTWKLHEPKKAEFAVTQPGAVVLVPRFTGKVVFEQTK